MFAIPEGDLMRFGYLAYLALRNSERRERLSRHGRREELREERRSGRERR
ncbi:hypothetical protein AB0O28_32325 [Microbispora sp. NPDC088329]